MKLKVNDQVIVLRGKDKGKTGKIIRVLPKEDKVVVEGLNLYVKHIKPLPLMNREGERTVQERPLHAGKVAILNDRDEPDRIGYKFKKDGAKVRIFKKTGKVVDEVETDQNKEK